MRLGPTFVGVAFVKGFCACVAARARMAGTLLTGMIDRLLRFGQWLLGRFGKYRHRSVDREEKADRQGPSSDIYPLW